MQRAQHAAKLASLSSKWRLTNLPDVKAWEIRREDIVICKRPDGSDHLLGSGAFGQVCELKCCARGCLCLKVLGRGRLGEDCRCKEAGGNRRTAGRSLHGNSGARCSSAAGGAVVGLTLLGVWLLNEGGSLTTCLATAPEARAATRKAWTPCPLTSARRWPGHVAITRSGPGAAV